MRKIAISGLAMLAVCVPGLARAISPREEKARPPLYWCKVQGVPAPVMHLPAGVLRDLGHGVTAVGDRRAPVDKRFHLRLRATFEQFDLYADGTVDTFITAGAMDVQQVRYHVPKADVSALAARLREAGIWKQVRAGPLPEDYLPDTVDLEMGGRNAKDLSPQPALLTEIAQVLRRDLVRNDLDLRTRLLDANGFAFNSTAGADFAVAAAERRGYSDTDIEKYLLRYKVPCVGGLHETLIVPPMGDVRAMRLRDALIAGGHPKLAARMEAGPPVKPSPPPQPPLMPVRWAWFPGADDMTNYYPRRAAKDEIEGSVTIECSLTGDGAPTDCKVVNERPARYGFGRATIRMVGDRARAGTFTSGQRFRQTVTWRLN